MRDSIFMGNYISYQQKYFTCRDWVSDYDIDTHFFNESLFQSKIPLWGISENNSLFNKLFQDIIT